MTSNKKKQENKPALKFNFTKELIHYETFSDIFLCHRALLDRAPVEVKKLVFFETP